MLKIAENLQLPPDFATERIAFLARTGAGKSGGMRVLQEAMFAAGQFTVVIDPVKGDLWGIRAAGHGAGLPVLILGGDHGDVPLQPTAGKFTAEFLVRERVSTVLDLSDFSKAEMLRFVADFGSTLYRHNRDVMHVFIDEADAVAGEKFYDPRCLEAIQMIQNKGRGRGFGVTVATQRSAIVNKSVLFASGTLIAMQTTAPKDIAVIKEWLDVCGTPEVTKQIVHELPRLKTREAFVYSPQLLGAEAQRITFKAFETFDSMRTPRLGEARKKPKSLAQLDLSAVQRDMATQIEEARASDPTHLKQQLAKARQELKRLEALGPKKEVQEKVVEKIVEKPILTEVEQKNLHNISELLIKMEERMATIRQFVSGLDARLAKLTAATPARPVVAIKPPPPPTSAPRSRSTSFWLGATPGKSLSNVNVNGELPEGEKAVLTAIVQLESTSRTELSLLTGYATSTRNTYLQRLLAKGLVRYQGDAVLPTEQGVAALGDYEPLPTGDALRQYWYDRLPDGEAAVLNVVCACHPDVASREQISQATGYANSTRNTYLQRLQARKLVIADREGIRASDKLFG